MLVWTTIFFLNAISKVVTKRVLVWWSNGGGPGNTQIIPMCLLCFVQYPQPKPSSEQKTEDTERYLHIQTNIKGEWICLVTTSPEHWLDWLDDLNYVAKIHLYMYRINKLETYLNDSQYFRFLPFAFTCLSEMFKLLHYLLFCAIMDKIICM